MGGYGDFFQPKYLTVNRDRANAHPTNLLPICTPNKDRWGIIPPQVRYTDYQSERQRAETERSRSQRLSELLRSQGIDPDSIT